MTTLAERLRGTPYDAYVYAYPHKTAYGPIATRLDALWKKEDRRALFLYVHVPFCEMRCGFCNLFTTPRPKEDVVERYVDVLERQAARVFAAVGEAAYARFAIGGGTPTLLPVPALARVLNLAANRVDLAAIRGSVETSPETCSREHMALLRERGIDRISIGVQSFDEAESASVSRPQKTREVEAALDVIRAAGFPVLNLDLIYGLPDQTPASWQASLRAALRWEPEELYLYPLYVRPVTTLGRRSGSWDDERLALYRLACDYLGQRGYVQRSMRMFEKRRAGTTAATAVYCVQDDGMVGLGPGARSYTREVHYSTEWAVGARGVRQILGAWLDAPDAAFDEARWGFALSPDEQRRRWALYALLVTDGLGRADYTLRFGRDAFADLPLDELVTTGCATESDGTLRLTALGIERSDTIGPWLFSEDVRTRMRSFSPR